MYLFVGKLLFVDLKSTVPVSHYFMMSEAHPFLNFKDQGDMICVWECPISVWLFLTFLPFRCVVVLFSFLMN